MYEVKYQELQYEAAPFTQTTVLCLSLLSVHSILKNKRTRTCNESKEHRGKVYVFSRGWDIAAKDNPPFTDQRIELWKNENGKPFRNKHAHLSLWY